jgi:pSer/pThr/pTyr-binding forkhead associated (FHA) protein
MTRERAPETMAFRLRGEVGGRALKFLLAQGNSRIGSHPDNEIVIAEPCVTRHHAVLHLDGASMVVEDPGSRNGTLVNGELVAAGALAEQPWVVADDAQAAPTPRVVANGP